MSYVLKSGKVYQKDGHGEKVLVAGKSGAGEIKVYASLEGVLKEGEAFATPADCLKANPAVVIDGFKAEAVKPSKPQS